MTISEISAAVQAASADAAPVEKLSMAGTRPWKSRPKSVTTDARDVGSRTPTRSCGLVRAASRPPKARQAATSRSYDSGANSRSSTIGWLPPWMRRASSSASVNVVSMGAVANSERTMASASARRSAARRLRPTTPSGEVRRSAGRMRIRIFGNQRRRTLPPRRENGEYSAPSIRTGTSDAPVRSAITAGPS